MSAFVDEYMAKLKERTAADLYTDKAAKERDRLRDQYNEVWAQLNRIGSTVTIASGKTAIVRCDGTNFFRCTADV